MRIKLSRLTLPMLLLGLGTALFISAAPGCSGETTYLWENLAYLKSPNNQVEAGFQAMAVSGDTIVVGAYRENDYAGRAYVFRRSGSNITLEAQLVASNTDSGDFFGSSVAISGDVIVVGALEEDSRQTTVNNGTAGSGDNSGDRNGAAYVFRRTAGTWQEEAYLKASNTDDRDHFGSSVAISEDTIVVSAYAEASNQTSITNGPGSSSDNSASQAGAVYVFRRTGGTWAQEAYIKASNAGANMNFGHISSLSQDTLAVGTPAESSNQQSVTNGSGASSNTSAAYSGAVYIFQRTGTTWVQEAYLKASNAAENDNLGSHVAIDGDTVVVGAVGEDSNATAVINSAEASSNNDATSAGAAYVFKRTNGSWAQAAYLKAPNAAADFQFGSSVAVSGDSIVVGSRYENSNHTSVVNGSGASSDASAVRAGAAYIFKLTESGWGQTAYLKAPNAEAGDWFGYMVGISDDVAAVAAPYEASNQTTISLGAAASSDNSFMSSGAVYLFNLVSQE